MGNGNKLDGGVVMVERGSSLGGIIGVILIIVLAAGIWYLGFSPDQGAFGGATEGNDINLNVNLPNVAPAAS